MTAVVFTGPTLPQAEAAARVRGTVLPPARQGDIWRAVRTHRPAAIGLIDGVFFHEPAVWHREILWAMAEGVHVFGAASMGALRAAELAPFGMRGVGRVFACFRDGVWPGFSEPFEDDDEVAVIHAPAELGHAPLSDAMVDLRDTLLAASGEGIITTAEAKLIAQRLKDLPFGQRNVAQMVEIAADCLAPASGPGLRAWLPCGVVRRKRLDALALLDSIEAFLTASPEPFIASFRLEHVQAWHDFITAPAPLTDAEALVLEEARLRTEDWQAVVRAALGRLGAVRAAPEPAESTTNREIDRFRLTRGLGKRRDLDVWLADNALTPDRLMRTIEDEAALTAALAQPPAGLDTAILDHLRLTGGFTGLLQRALAKRAKLAGLQPPVSGPVMDAALGWYAEQSGRVTSMPDRSAWADEAAFHEAVWREYVFAREQTP